MSCRHPVVVALAVAVAFLAASVPPASADEATGDSPTAGLGRTPAADALIRAIGQTDWLGDDVRGVRGAEQTVTETFRRRGGLDVLIRVENETDAVATVTIRGSRGDEDVAVLYSQREVDVSAEVMNGTFQIRDVAPGNAVFLRMRMKTRRTQRKGAVRHVDITARAGSVGTGDTVRAVLDYPPFTADQRAAADLVNATRVTSNRPELPLDFDLSERAQTWSDYMAATGTVENSGLFWGLPSRWRSVAEVVGADQTLTVVHQRLVADRGEHLKMVGDWTSVGTGVATANGRTYVTYVFLLI